MAIEPRKQELDEDASDDDVVLIDLEDDGDDVEAQGADDNEEVEAEQEDEAEASDEEDAVQKTVESDDEEPDFDKFGKRAQKRIRSLVARSKQAEEELEALRKQQEEWERDKQRFQVQSLKQASDVLESRISITKRALREARSEGDDDKVMDLEQELQDFNFQRNQVNAALNQFGDDDNDVEATKKVEKKPEAKKPVEEDKPPEPSARTKQWLDSNKWFNTDKTAQAVAMVIHQNLMDEGYGAGDEDEYFEELDRRLRQELPNKFTSKKKGAPVAGKRNLTRGSAAPGRRQVTLTKRQLDYCKRNGIDPKVYAKKWIEKHPEGV